MNNIKRTLFGVAIFMALIGALVWMDPVHYNDFITGFGLPKLTLPEPTVNVGGCDLTDGDSFSFEDGLWTTSTGCRPDTQFISGGIAVPYANGTRHAFNIVEDSAISPMHHIKDKGDCVFVFGMNLIPSKIHALPGCTGLFKGHPNESLAYHVEYDFGFPNFVKPDITVEETMTE